MTEEYKFQKLQVYQLALAYVDAVYELSQLLPERERDNLASQIERAAASIVLNIAEGSTGQSDLEQNRFLVLALRSFLENIPCFDLIKRRAYIGLKSFLLFASKVTSSLSNSPNFENRSDRDGRRETDSVYVYVKIGSGV